MDKQFELIRPENPRSNLLTVQPITDPFGLELQDVLSHQVGRKIYREVTMSHEAAEGTEAKKTASSWSCHL